MSPIKDGRHSFGSGFAGGGGALGVGGQNIGGIQNNWGRNEKQGMHHADGFATTSLLLEGAGALSLTAAEGCGVAAIRTTARSKARWDLDGAIGLRLCVAALVCSKYDDSYGYGW